MQFLFSIVAASVLAAPASSSDEFSSATDYTLYETEFTTHPMMIEEPLAKLITRRVAESMFETNDNAEFLRRINSLQNAYKQNPQLAERFQLLDGHLKRQFEQRLKKAKTKRMIFAASGAVIGALVAIPVGRLFTSSAQLTQKSILIAIPTGALAGSGAGFLLGQLIAMPHYKYDSNALTRDLNLDLNIVNE